ncbi:MAG: hypothetical protein M3495_17650 [Pseudomonadota bacterium]|nr:hypothetical protein [Gammaproteobacteria bacterium]MDQ3583313.1 hypothetical protein [Pseudomonadota bacterium]
MNDLIDPRTRIWAVGAVIGGIGLYLSFDLIEEPDATALGSPAAAPRNGPDRADEHGVVLLFRVQQRQREVVIRKYPSLAPLARPL